MKYVLNRYLEGIWLDPGSVPFMGISQNPVYCFFSKKPVKKESTGVCEIVQGFLDHKPRFKKAMFTRRHTGPLIVCFYRATTCERGY